MTGATLEIMGLQVMYGPTCDSCRGRDGGHVCSGFGRVRAAHLVTVGVGKGEIVGIVGESGSGKSSVLAAANLDMQPSAGRIVLNGIDALGLQGTARRRYRNEQVGIVVERRCGRAAPLRRFGQGARC